MFAMPWSTFEVAFGPCVTASKPRFAAVAGLVICALGIRNWPFGSFAFSIAMATGLILLAGTVVPKLFLMALIIPCVLRSSVRPMGTVTSLVASLASARR